MNNACRLVISGSCYLTAISYYLIKRFKKFLEIHRMIHTSNLTAVRITSSGLGEFFWCDSVNSGTLEGLILLLIANHVRH